MTAIDELVRALLDHGRARLRRPPRVTDADHESVVGLLTCAYHDHRLDVAGPLLPFVPETALRACEFTLWACWFLVHHDEPPAAVELLLSLPPPPRTPADHLSGDLTFRFLPAVHRRARALDPSDILTQRVEALLRRWPLSGVLADLDHGPDGDVAFGHAGLNLLYAERLAARVRPAWVVAGDAAEAIELVFHQKGIRGLP